MKNYSKIILNYLFKENNINQKNIQDILKNRKFYNKKENIFTLLPYQNQEVRKGIIDLKFKNNKANAIFFGELLFENLADYFLE
jgi:hypothetical protein